MSPMMFFVPLNHTKMKPNGVRSLTDVTELLNTIRFWGLDIFPTALFNYASVQPHADLFPTLEPFHINLPFITAMCSIVSEEICSKLRVERAMETGNLDGVRYVYKKWLGSFSVHAIASAAGKGALDCLQYALNFVKSYDVSHRMNVFTEAVRNGHMDCILFLNQKGFYLGGGSTDLAAIAASSGQYEILVYLHSQRCSMHSTAIAAADAGHWDCLDYAIKNGAPLRNEYRTDDQKGTLAQRLARANQPKLFPLALSHDSKMDAQTALSFATTGNLECLKLCLDHGAQPSFKLFAAAAEMGHLACLQLLHQVWTFNVQASGKDLHWLSNASKQGNRYLRSADVAQMTAISEHWECLRFLIEHGCEMNKSLTTRLVQAKQLDLYHLATAHGCGVSVPAACQFAKDGNLVLLQHALEHGGCRRSDEILQAAARYGKLQCLKYARAQGCPWSPQVSLEAARGGHLECLQYLHEHGCPWDARVRSGKRKQCIADYADAHDCPF